MDEESRDGPRDGWPEPSPQGNASGAPNLIGHPLPTLGLVELGPHLGRVILWRRVVVSSLPSGHTQPKGSRTQTLLLLAMDKLLDRMDASRVILRTSDICIAGL